MMSEQVDEKDDQNSFFGGGSDEAEGEDNQESPDKSEDELVEIKKSEYESLKEERDEFEEKFLRKTADLDNLRKRKEKEKDELRKYAHTDILSDLIEVIDNVDRAIESLDIENDDVSEGVRMIKNQLHELIEKYDVEPIDAQDQPFDPHKHEGMMREERDDLNEQRVIEVFKKGYKLHDRILRPASVKVGVPSSENDEESPDAEGDVPEN